MKTGTKEWAEKNINIAKGCSHNCRYCYAREMLIERFRLVRADEWPKMKVDQAKVDKAYRKSKGRVMLFSSHDWTPEIMSEGLCVLRKLLEAGNQVLIVSKPHWQVITLICESYQEYKEQLEFRFTIGSIKDDVLAFWDRNAPNFTERLSCLEYAFHKGYKTSVSCEPFLDAFVAHIYDACIAYITESFWIGKLNQFDKRVQLDDVNKQQYKTYVEPLKNCLTKTVIKAIYKTMKDKPKVQWKDSIRKMLGIEELESQEQQTKRQIPCLLSTKKVKQIELNM